MTGCQAVMLLRWFKLACKKGVGIVDTESECLETASVKEIKQALLMPAIEAMKLHRPIPQIRGSCC